MIDFPNLNDSGWKLATMTSTGAFTNIRSQPLLTGKIVGRIVNNESIRYFPDKSSSGWYPVIKDSQEGWVHQDYVSIIEIEQPPATFEGAFVKVPLPEMLLTTEQRLAFIKILEWLVVIFKNMPEFVEIYLPDENSVPEEDMQRYKDTLNAILTSVKGESKTAP